MTQICEIQKEFEHHPKDIIKILKLIKISRTSIHAVEFTQAEMFLRHLITNTEYDPYHPYHLEQSLIKTTSKQILRQWSDLRRTKLMREMKQIKLENQFEIIQQTN